MLVANRGGGESGKTYLAHIGESLEPGTTPSERSVDILVFFL